MPGRSFKIARIAGIPVGVNPWWLLIVVLFTWILGDSYYPSVVPGISAAASYGLGLLSILLLFASVLAHEFGHAIVARRHGIEVEEIDLWLLGGVSRLKGHPEEAGDELRYAAAGPLVTAVIAAVFGLIAVALPGSAPATLRAVVDYQVYTNVALLFFNLVPAFPLDGGRIARALLWRRRHDLAAATRTAAGVGRVFGWLMIVLGGFSFLEGAAAGVVLALIGGFVVMAAGAEEAQEQVFEALAGVSASEVMSAPAITVGAEATLDDAERAFARHRGSVLPVVDAEGRVVGLLSLEQLERLLRAGRQIGRVGEIADPDPEILVTEDEDIVKLFERPAFARTGHAVVVTTDHRPVGIVSKTDIERMLRLGRLRGGGRGTDTLVHDH
ncbi:MAG TPA: site-2 protease family protein [Solirubrobacteraceae bacterium]|nr:site-2 protease family protein [Solirubrobacteraceae bacterium]